MERPKIIRLPISKHIDVNFRNYALYVLESRGIPGWEDALTNVQRIILQNAPSSFDKTLSLVGDCFKDGYHHGDASLVGAIHKLARPVGCADNLLSGDGFLGSPVNHEAAAPRYTQVKLNPEYSSLLKENHFLNKRDEEGRWNALHLRLPVGITTFMIGIAVGYKSTILPRSLKDVQKFLDGKTKEVKPFFKDFKGKVTRYQNLDKTWLIEGAIEYDDKNCTLRITDLPPMMKYASFLKKLDKIIEDHYGRCSVTNNSTANIDLKVKFTGFANDWQHFKTVVEKATKILVTETPVFVKNGLVIQYDKIEDYLTDFKYRIAEVDYKKASHFYDETCFDLDYNKAKKQYLEFMLVKKRTESEITKFFSSFSKKIASKLDGTLLRHLNEEELKRTVAKIEELEKLKKERNVLKNELYNKFVSMTDVSETRGIRNKASKDLLDDIDNIDGIDFFKGEDIDIPEFDDDNEKDEETE